jgi:two-component system CheB/CheR fusion protein
MPPTPDRLFEELLEFVRSSRGFDYSGYKRPSLMRRFEKRLQAVHAADWGEYRAYLEKNPDEFVELFNTILINVTAFFRDPEAWAFLAEEVIPKLVEQKPQRSQIRVWSAGCASGEEPYTLAMLLCEALGDDTFKERVKIYATDVDELALAQARTAAFTPKQLQNVPDELRAKYFTGSNHLLAFRSDIRRVVIFGRNDLMQDPPISRVDLLVSRNTLMYFNAAAQDRILSNFYFALGRRGFLMLGKAEALQSRTSFFQPYDLKTRIFAKNAGVEAVPRRAPAEIPEGSDGDEELVDATEPAFEQAPLAQLVVDVSNRVSAVNHAARAMFGIKTRDLGKPLQDLQISYRPLELRSLIDQVRTGRRPLTTKEVEWSQSDGDTRHLDVQISPLSSGTGELIGFGITFSDVSRYRVLHDELERARRDLESAYEELQATVEELETTNEELQSTNEELETTNEELQSTNEELETMNEELQSTNEELETMNDELRERTDSALEASSFLSSILAGIRQSVIVVNADFRVAAWSEAARELWGLRADEIQGQNFLDLDIGIPVAELRAPIRAVLRGSDAPPTELVGHNRRGQPIHCTISFARLNSHRDEVNGVVLVVDAHRDGSDPT